MISVIVVYNDVRILNEWLLESLKNQSADYELIALDNRKGDFPSAANAYNYGGLRARGDYLMFVHQDVRLLGNTWIEEAERILRNLPKLGAAGVAGKRCDIRGVITNAIHGVPPRPAGQIRISKPVKVQTLDPLLIIVPRKVFQRLKYDEHTCNGWHLYSIPRITASPYKGRGSTVMCYHFPFIIGQQV
ncbi:glycosyltransferase [Pyrodictium occultum]|uniref:glycosyltransferase n=1 Tax=Pyrodictium occultum TaxID=2309 RepID=UPI0009F92F37|nr:glycosyltransferase [Pyrodictium occultum]